MTTLAGLTIDFIDNPRLIQGVQIPDYIKEAARTTPAITSQDYERMSEHDFGVVFLTKQGYHIPKYPIHDKFHTWAATVTFDKTAMKLPPEARMIAAINIKRACVLHGVEAPAYLNGIEDVQLLDSNPQDNVYDMNRPPRITKSASLELVEEQILKVLTPAQRIAFRDKQDLSTTAESAVNVSALSAALGVPSNPGEFNTPSIKASPDTRANPHATVDVMSQAVKDVYLTKAASSMHLLSAGDMLGVARKLAFNNSSSRLPDSEFAVVVDGERKYPIYNSELTKQAADYFAQRYVEMAPSVRRQFSIKLANKCAQFGIAIPSIARQYIGSECGNAFDGNILLRKDHFDQNSDAGKTAHAILDVLSEKRASMAPDQLASGLEMFDREYGLQSKWDSAIGDPYYTVFSTIKRAAFSYDDGQTSINENDLMKLAQNSDVLNGYFDNEFVTEFSRNPVEIFSSMPRHEKSLIMKAASGKLEKRSSVKDIAITGAGAGVFTGLQGGYNRARFGLQPDYQEAAIQGGTIGGAGGGAVGGVAGGTKGQVALGGTIGGAVGGALAVPAHYLGAGAGNLVNYFAGMKVARDKTAGLEASGGAAPTPKGGGMTPATHGQPKPLYGGNQMAIRPVIPFGPDVSGVQIPSARVDESSSKMASVGAALFGKLRGNR